MKIPMKLIVTRIVTSTKIFSLTPVPFIYKTPSILSYSFYLRITLVIYSLSCSAFLIFINYRFKYCILKLGLISELALLIFLYFFILFGIESSSLQIGKIYSLSKLDCTDPSESLSAFHWLFQISIIVLIQITVKSRQIVVIILIAIEIKVFFEAIKKNISIINHEDDIFTRTSPSKLKLNGANKGTSDRSNPLAFSKSSLNDDQSGMVLTEPDNKTSDIKISDYQGPSPIENKETESKIEIKPGNKDKSEQQRLDKSIILEKSILKSCLKRSETKKKSVKFVEENEESHLKLDQTKIVLEDLKKKPEESKKNPGQESEEISPKRLKKSKSKNKKKDVKFDQNTEEKPHKKLNQTRIALDEIRKKNNESDSEENTEKIPSSKKQKTKKSKNKDKGVKFTQDTEEKSHKKLNQTKIALDDIRKNKEEIYSEDISEIQAPSKSKKKASKKDVKFDENSEEKPHKKLNQTKIALEEVRKKKDEIYNDDFSDIEVPKGKKNKEKKAVNFDQDSEEKPHKKLNQTKVALEDLRKAKEDSEDSAEKQEKVKSFKTGIEDSEGSSDSSDFSSEDSSDDSESFDSSSDYSSDDSSDESSSQEIST